MTRLTNAWKVQQPTAIFQICSKSAVFQDTSRDRTRLFLLPGLVIRDDSIDTMVCSGSRVDRER